MKEKLKTSDERVKTLASKLKSAEAEAKDIDNIIFHLLGFERKDDDKLTRTKAYEDVGSSIEDLMNSCRGIANKLSFKRASTKVMETVTNMMSMVRI
ncbi:hypothetical protein QYE76_043906 [Lolium multiflorum]|uniref:Uncharacterized protein n=1 Tax=Lolium multiflorum TaxID=4521 RepID=A0AAD8WYL9_LOLMU|nr:hypothetical protein QYE76_043906 [Lolium multiflorum]